MNHFRSDRLPALLVLLSALAGCGGGSDNAPAPGGSTPLTYPSSGPYGWTLKATGSTNGLKHGLSLVHPSLPDNEYVIEVAGAAITDTHLVVSGVVNPSQLTATSIQPHALVYIFGGDVRSVPMQADGTAPLNRVTRSQTRSACRFILSANDHATPDNSRFIVSTAGTDGICGTSDDGLAEVRLSASGALGYTPLSAEQPLEVARDPVTLAPRGWIYPRSVVLWSPSTTITTRPAGTNAITSVVASTYNSALVADGSRLSVMNFASANTVTEVPLDPTLTAGSDWRLIGFDAEAFYVYDGNPANTVTSPWQVLKITRANPTATALASGTGLISIASMGSGVLYLTVFTPTDNRLVRISKASGARFETTHAVDVKPSVQTSANGRHQQWVVTGVGSANVSHAIDIVDESGNVLYSAAGGFPLSVAEAGTENFNASESRTRFIFAKGFGARAFNGATLVSYDAMTGTPNELGNLPGAAEYGTDFAFAAAVGGPTSFGVGYAVRSGGGNYLDQSAKVFSFDMGTANSMKAATNH